MRARHAAKRWGWAGGLRLGLLALLAVAVPPVAGGADPFEAMDVQPAAAEFAAPTFRLRTPEGKFLALRDLKGKVVAFYFWRTW